VYKASEQKSRDFFLARRVPHQHMEDALHLHANQQTPVKARVQSMYHDAHMRQKLITEVTGVPRSTVNRWVHEKTKRRVGKNRLGRPHRISKHDIRLLIFNIRKGHAGRKLSWAKLALESGLDTSATASSSDFEVEVLK
jgi:hypothetical protein